MQPIYENGFSVEIVGYKVRRIDTDIVALPNNTTYSIKLENNRNTQCNASVKIDGAHVGVYRLEPYDSWVIERPQNIGRTFVFHSETSASGVRAGVVAGSPYNGQIEVEFVPEYVPGVSHTEDYEPERMTMRDRMRYTYVPGTRAPRRRSTRDDFDPSRYHYSDDSDEGDSDGPRVDSRSRSRYDHREDVCDDECEDAYSSKTERGATVLGGVSTQKFGSTRELSAIDHDNITTITLTLVARIPRLRQLSIPEVAPTAAAGAGAARMPRPSILQRFMAKFA